MSIQSNNTMTRKEKWVYILMIIPYYLMAAAYLLTIYEFFHDELGLLPQYFYIASIIYMVVNAVNDPLLAMWSDGTNPRKWGSKRLIFIRWGGVFWALSFAFTWIPWSTTNQFLIFLQYTTFMCMLDNGLSLVVMCWMALMPEMESDNNNRIKIGYYAGIFIFVAGLLGALIIGIKDTGWDNFRILAFGIAGFVIITTFITTALIKERPEFQHDKRVPFWKGISGPFKMKSFMLFVGYNLFFNVIPAGFGASFVYLYILVIPGLDYIYYVLLTSIGTFFIPLIALQFKKKWGMKNTIIYIGLLTVFGTLLLYAGTLIFDSNILALLGILFMSWVGGIPKAFTFTYTSLSMDEYEVKYGVRRETTFLGVNALLTKPGDSVGTIIVTAILASTGYIENAPAIDQPLAALNGIKMFMLYIPVMFMLIGLLFIVFYPLYGKKLEKLMEDIEKLHAEKKNLIHKQS